MNASSILRMMLQHVTTPGWRLARHAVYSPTRTRPQVGGRLAHRALGTHRLQTHLHRRYSADGYLCSCARLTSVFAAALGLLKTPSPETVRKALLANAAKIDLLEARINNALRAARPSRLPKRAHLAIDLVLIPYHGQPHQHANELYRGQVKSGTTH